MGLSSSLFTRLSLPRSFNSTSSRIHSFRLLLSPPTILVASSAPTKATQIFTMRLFASASAVLAFAASVIAQTPGFNPIFTPSLNQEVPAGENFEITWEATEPYKNANIKISLIGGGTQGTQQPIQDIASGIKNSAQSYSWAVDASLGADAVYGLIIPSRATPASSSTLPPSRSPRPKRLRRPRPRWSAPRRASPPSSCPPPRATCPSPSRSLPTRPSTPSPSLRSLPPLPPLSLALPTPWLPALSPSSVVSLSPCSLCKRVDPLLPQHLTKAFFVLACSREEVWMDLTLS